MLRALVPIAVSSISRFTQSSQAFLTVHPVMAATRRSSRLNGRAEGKPPAEAMPPPPPAPQSQLNKRKRKAAPDAGEVPQAQPATPPRKRTQPMQEPPPLTPTPSAVKVIAEAADGSNKARNATVTRLADPRTTNATLLSPETSRLVASRDIEAISPSKAPAARTTTQTLLQEACEHLIMVDARLKPLIEKNHCRVFSPEGLAERIDPFESLSSGIISQQVSGAAAKSIKAKFVALFDRDGATGRFPHPSEVAKCSIEKLRTAGLSQRKAEYIQGLAEKFAAGELSAQMLHDVPYDELVEKLIAVRGLGRWSVEMFACFGLKRMDVFSVGDLGVQRGMAAFVGRDVAKLKAKGGKWKYMSEQDMLDLSSKFAPYRSLFMWLMWRVEETDVSTME
ncbi:DNA-3-methyladenine glycosylase II [Purpureocillium takamizusanense]|uniref:DNA-3-methyladenine glycosylase II n=1 Tax=Purpureocillium takamizusanense TaxID=2060973 RepID=A0A9Q8VBQ7_9HYPO|nr:DNA-3-methyladenine glycosylase II [Purpureocillium takamizusanense]UNI20780.1 DNA-3-methyladenine glycosylase II [Purpureocillium takamizusanense]